MTDEMLARLHAMHDAGEFHVERLEPGDAGNGRIVAFEEISPDLVDSLPRLLKLV